MNAKKIPKRLQNDVLSFAVAQSFWYRLEAPRRDQCAKF